MMTLQAFSTNISSHSEVSYTLDITDYGFKYLTYASAQSGNGLIWCLDVNNSTKTSLKFIVHNTTNTTFNGTTYPYIMAIGVPNV